MELIENTYILAELKMYCGQCLDDTKCDGCLINKLKSLTQDVVEAKAIIHCKDCKHALFSPRIKEGFCMCELTKTVPLNHYCGWGVKRD